MRPEDDGDIILVSYEEWDSAKAALEEELDRLTRFPWWAMVMGLFFGLVFGIVSIALVLVLV